MNTEFSLELSRGNTESPYSKVQTLVRTMQSVCAVTQGSVKSCGLWCMEPSFTLLLPPVMCFCLLPCLQSAASQLGLTFPFTAFDSLPHVAQKGRADQFKYSPHGFQRWPIATDSSSLSWFYPEEYGALQTSDRGAFSIRLLVSLPPFPLSTPNSISPFFCALNINTFHT